MSLLTEEQIEDLEESLLLYNGTMINGIRKWNEKQTGVQVNVNWELAPKEATSVDIRFHWRGVSWALGPVLKNIPRPTTPHPHAEIIAKYAKVAARRCDPWVEFEWFDEYDKKWKGNHSATTFNAHNQYRHIGDKQ